MKPCLVCLYDNTTNTEIDTDATMTGHITITPLSCNLTDADAYAAIKKSFKK